MTNNKLKYLVVGLTKKKLSWVCIAQGVEPKGIKEENVEKDNGVFVETPRIKTPKGKFLWVLWR